MTCAVYDDKFFSNWLTELKEKIESSILPNFDSINNELEEYKSCTQNWWDAQKSVLEKRAALTKAKKNEPVDEDAIAEAEQEVTEAVEILGQNKEKCMNEFCIPVLDFLHDNWVIQDEIDAKEIVGDDDSKYEEQEGEILLLQGAVIAHATPQYLGKYCSENEENANRIIRLLKGRNAPLLKRMLMNAGPSKGKYGAALEIYERILNLEGEYSIAKEYPFSIYGRLALAVALALAEPIPIFGHKDIFIDPIERYCTYHKAYAAGDLDPIFETLTVWELSMVVDSDARDEELDWGREMLQNYRPDIIYTDDYAWRYSFVVKSDVGYGKPGWANGGEPTYKEIINHGGRCGPRAFFGRMICKTFGIPTWGVTQPGHAALFRYTPNDGWAINLGAGINKSSWQGHIGLDFELETEARKKLSEETYFREVGRPNWLSIIFSEKNAKLFPPQFTAEPTMFWWTLGLMQRYRCREQQQEELEGKSCLAIDEQFHTETKIEQLKNKKFEEESISFHDDGTIMIPAFPETCTEKNNNAERYNSFSGGSQLLLKKNGFIQYTLPASESTEKSKYNITIQVVTVHEKDTSSPLVLTVIYKKGEDKTETNHSISIPYTEGVWKETDPVEIEVGDVDTETFLKLTRDNAPCTTIKQTKLIPI